MTGNPAQSEGIFIMDDTPDKLFSQDAVVFRRSNIVPHAIRRIEHCARHSQRFEKYRIDVPVEFFAADALDDLSEENEIEIAVHRGVSGVVNQFRLIDRIKDLLRRFAREIQPLERREPSVVNEQVPDLYLLFSVISELRNA